MTKTRILVPSGVLGLGFDSAALQLGLTLSPHAICIDGGSTDSGPFYLGTGSSKYSEAAIKHEWRELMLARHQAGIPLIIGSCGTCGTDSMVDWMYTITCAIAEELGQSLRVARLYSSQKNTTLVKALDTDKIHTLQPKVNLSSTLIERCDNIVALAGVEQINAALEHGPDIVLAGRTTDTAVIAALPLQRGAAVGAAWHGAKIAECGALCSSQPTSGVIMVEFDDHGFEVQALAADALCTPHSVSAHMLYENADPIRLHEPGGVLDVEKAEYKAIDGGRVRVSGSHWRPDTRYTVKLEGASHCGYQTSSLVLLRQPEYVRSASEWSDALQKFLNEQVQQKMKLSDHEFDIEFRLIGRDATLGICENKPGAPSEIGVLVLFTASSQELAHFPLSTTESLPTFAFPYSPVESERGPLYEFTLNHVLELETPMDAFRLTVEEVAHGHDS